jgi:hypothetical protein
VINTEHPVHNSMRSKDDWDKFVADLGDLY